MLSVQVSRQQLESLLCIDIYLDMASEKVLATFRIDPEKWEQFKNAAGNEGANASSLLLEFVDWYLDGNRLRGKESASPTPDNLDEVIDARIAALLDDRGLTAEAMKERLQESTAYLAHGLNDVVRELREKIEAVEQELGKAKAR